MGRRMKLQVFLHQLRAAMIVHNGVDPFAFIEFEPSRLMRLLISFVLHRKLLVQSERFFPMPPPLALGRPEMPEALSAVAVHLASSRSEKNGF